MNSICVSELLELSVFKCKYCNKRCQYPVMVAENEGNYCASCLEVIQPSSKEENSEINKILEKLIVPCRFNENGCGVHNDIVQITTHEKICQFQDRFCPLNVLDQCTIPKILNYVDHFNKYHPEYIITSENDVVDVSCNLVNNANDIFRLLVMYQEYFLLHIKQDTKSKFLFALFLCGDQDNIRNYDCYIQDNYKNSKILNLLHESDFSIPMQKNSAINFDLIMTSKSVKIVNVKVKIVAKNGACVKNKELLNNLKCPFCSNYMYDEIHQCGSGHSICNKCIIELQKCPTCNASFSGTRNYTLESLSALLKYPCRNRGCSIFFSKKNIQEHEDICSFKEYNCPFNQSLNCVWNGTYEHVKLHLMEDHCNQIVQDNNIQKLISLNDLKTAECYLIHFNTVFYCYIKRSVDTYDFVCKCIGPKTLAQHFVFGIELINQQHKTSLMFKNRWYQNTDEAVIKVHNHNVSLYITQQLILVDYKIVKCSVQHF